MEPTRLTARDYRSLGLWFLAAAVSLFAAVHYHDEAFPTASVDFQITRTEAEELASGFLAEQGYDTNDYRAVTVFDYDDNAKVYLERELGLARADSVMRRDVTIWRWRSRFFRPSEQEEFTVSCSPDGQLVAFRHEVEEAREGADWTQEDARSLAIAFASREKSLDLSRFQMMEGVTSRRTNRTDHAFTWERTDFKAGDATFRVAISVQGDEVGRYSEYLKIPESWRRDYSRLRSRNMLMQEVTQSAFFAIIFAMLVMFVAGMGKRQLTYRFGAQCGALLAICSLALALNALPLAFTQYDTTQSLNSFYGSFIFSTIIGACLN